MNCIYLVIVDHNEVAWDYQVVVDLGTRGSMSLLPVHMASGILYLGILVLSHAGIGGDGIGCCGQHIVIFVDVDSSIRV